MSNKAVKVAIIQASPVHQNLVASLDKLASLAKEAADGGAKLVTFGETWLSGYPAWLDHCPSASLWDHAPTKQVFAQLRANSIDVQSPESGQLAQLARDLDIVLVVGANERTSAGEGSGTLYNSLLTYGPNGQLIGHHRKLVPTYTERLVWGPGDGAGLQAVDTPIGRVGGLVCWEHWMPLARQKLHESFEQIHIAAWPTVHEMHQVCSRHYAFEGRCFVLACGQIMSASQLPVELDRTQSLKDNPDQLVLNGGSAIYAPNGDILAGPIFDEETILTAELDLTAIDREVMTLDVTGHYARPDVFNFSLNEQTRERH